MHAEVSPREVARALSRRKFQVATVALAALAVASLASLVVPRTWRSSTRLEVRAVGGVQGREYAEKVRGVQEQILSSSTFGTVVRDLGLDRAVAGVSDSDPLRAKLVEGYVRATKVLVEEPAGGNFYVTIEHASSDPDTCHRVVQRLADWYRADLNEKPREEQRKVVEQRRSEEDSARASFETAQKAHDEHQQQNSDLLDGAETRLAQVRSEMQGLENVEVVRLKEDLARLEKLLAEEQPFTKTVRLEVDQVRMAELEKRIREVEEELTHLTVVRGWTEEYPDVKAKRAVLKKLDDEKRTLEAAARKVEDLTPNPVHAEYKSKHFEVASALSIAEIKLRELRKTERDLQARAKQSGPVRNRLRDLEREASGLRTAWDERRRAREAAENQLEVLEKERGLVFSVVDPPVRPLAPSSPGPALFALGGLASGVVAGAVLALALDRADRSFRDADAVAEALGVPSLGAIHRITTPQETVAERSAVRRRTALIALLAAASVACAAVAVVGRDAASHAAGAAAAGDR